MLPEKYGFAAIAQHLVALFEARRPGIARWDADALGLLRREADEAISRMETQCRELGVDDPPHWRRAREVVEHVFLPRYARLAEEENALAARDYGLWRGGDLIARGTFALAGLVLGAAMVAIPWIPIYEKWFPWALFILGPFIPDAYVRWYRRKHAKKLEQLVLDLAREGAALEAYRPLSEVQRSLGVAPEETPAAPARTSNRIR